VAAHTEIVYLTQWDDEYAPPEKPLLGVSVVGDEVFLYITDCEETSDTATYTTIASVNVRLTDLILALEAAAGGHLASGVNVTINAPSGIDTKALAKALREQVKAGLRH
jgi:hypothetical protein